jgi:hypothetical protein
MMRKELLALLFAWSLVACSIVYGTDIMVGFKAGAGLRFIAGEAFLIDLNELDDSDDAQTGAKWGHSGGMYLAIGLTEKNSIQLEIFYTMLGGNYLYTSLGEEVFGWQVVHVLEIPLLLRSQTPFGPGILSSYMGLNAVFFLSDIITREESGNDSYVSIQKPFSPAALGLALGGSYEFPLGDAVLSFDIRLSATFTRIIRNTDHGFVSIFFLVGYGWLL